MSRFTQEVSRKEGQNTKTGLAHAYTVSGHCPVPKAVPFYPVPVPVCVPEKDLDLAKVALMSDEATGWEKAFIRGVLDDQRSSGHVTEKQASALAKVVANIAMRAAL